MVRSEFVSNGTIDDLKSLKGKKFSIGKRNSGTEGANRHLLNGLGMDPNSLDLAYLGYGPSADAMQNNAIKGMNTSAGVPVGAVTRAFAALGDKVSLLSFTEQQLQQADNGYQLWTPYTIPANTYPGQTKAVQTIAQPNFPAVRDDIPEEDVYLLTKSIYENLPFLQGIHKATKVMSIEKAIAGLPLPLHPGAARFYREQGISIPDQLAMQ
ncbi:MAG: TAXI family TRAP transporter solute-binding subunit [Motiliproteus sp.]